MSRYHGTGRAAITRQTTDVDAMAREMTERRRLAYMAWMAGISIKAIAAGHHFWVEDSDGETIRLEPHGKKSLRAVKGSKTLALGMPMVRRLLTGLNKPAGPEKYGDYTQAEIDRRRI